MLFSELLDAAEIRVGSRRGDAEVTSVQTDSRLCGPGACFVAVRGVDDDGHRYIRQAVDAGAAAVVCEDPAGTRPAASAVVCCSRPVVGPLAQAIRGWPSRKLVNVAVTGTNGKTTVTYLIRSILRAAGRPTALLGTIEYDTDGSAAPARTTTPGAVALAEMTAEALAAGKSHMVMEASSHALDQDRTAGIDFQAAVFTNLTGDHLDYHKTMDEYLAAKRRLFEGLGRQAVAIINRDDPAADAIAAATRAVPLWYGLSAAADLHARIDNIDGTGTCFNLAYQDLDMACRTQLIGRHNVFNCLAAAGACLGLGVDLATVAQALASCRSVRGRLERINVPAPYQVFVDYAHTDDALRNVLSSLRPITRGRIVLVFGCGGERDSSKRPRMAKVAEQLADRIFITSDNPRHERPEAIIDDILGGLGAAGRGKTGVEADRGKAIELAINDAMPDDLVLIAGKGHETYQDLGGRKVHFDDVETAGQVVRRREAGK